MVVVVVVVAVVVVGGGVEMSVLESASLDFLGFPNWAVRRTPAAKVGRLFPKLKKRWAGVDEDFGAERVLVETGAEESSRKTFGPSDFAGEFSGVAASVSDKSRLVKLRMDRSAAAPPDPVIPVEVGGRGDTCSTGEDPGSPSIGGLSFSSG